MSHAFPNLLLVLTLLLTACGPSEPPTIHTPADRPAPAGLDSGEAAAPAAGPLEEIRAKYAEVQQQLDAGTLRTDTLQVSCTRQDGDFFTIRYFDGEAVRMLRITTGIGHAFTTKRLYFDERGELFFAFVQDEQFSPVEAPDGQPSYLSQYTDTRYYVDDGRVIRQLTKTYAEQDWADNPDPDSLPNEVVDVPDGAPFPDADRLVDWKAGIIDC